jgi:hypothetical protein
MALSPKQIQAAELIARGYSHQEVGDAINVSRRTILRWLKQQDFGDLSYGLSHRAPQSTPQKPSERLSQLEVLRVQDLVPDALSAVRDILQNPDSRNCDRLKAASLIGEWGGLGVCGKMAELEALKILIEAEWIDDEAISVLVGNLQKLSTEMKNVLRGGN